MLLDVAGDIGADLFRQINVVRRKVRDEFEKQFTLSPIRSDRDRESFA